MTLIDLGEFKLRFDNKEVRISIDGETIDIGARKDDPSEFKCDDPNILLCNKISKNPNIRSDWAENVLENIDMISTMGDLMDLVRKPKGC